MLVVVIIVIMIVEAIGIFSNCRRPKVLRGRPIVLVAQGPEDLDHLVRVAGVDVATAGLRAPGPATTTTTTTTNNNNNNNNDTNNNTANDNNNDNHNTTNNNNYYQFSYDYKYQY